MSLGYNTTEVKMKMPLQNSRTVCYYYFFLNLKFHTLPNLWACNSLTYLIGRLKNVRG